MTSSPKTFKTDLWDGFETINAHSTHVLSFYKSAAKFLKRRAEIEDNYAKQLSKLCETFKLQTVTAMDQEKTSQPALTKSSFVPESSGTLGACWSTVTEQAERTSSAHNELFQTFSRLSNDLYTFVKDKDSERKSLNSQGRELVSLMNNQAKTLQSAKSNYHSQCKTVEKLQSDITKYQGNSQRTADLQKARSKKVKESQKVRTLETDYRKEINSFNSYQEKHIHELMPTVLNQYEAMENQRIVRFKNIISDYISIQNRIAPILRDSLMTTQFSCLQIDPDADIQTLIEAVSTGMPHPREEKFSEYGGALAFKTQGELEPEDSPFGGKDLSKIMEVQAAKEVDSDIPALVHALIKQLIVLDSTNATGIFRITGESSEVAILRGSLSRWDLDIKTQKPHVVATVLKMFLRGLADGLIPEKSYVNAIEAARENDESAIFKVFDSIPAVNQRIALHLIQFLRAYIATNSKTNMMNVQNLAIVFCPSFLRCPPEEKNNMMINSGAERYFTSVIVESYPIPEEYVTYYHNEYDAIIKENETRPATDDRISDDEAESDEEQTTTGGDDDTHPDADETSTHTTADE